MNELEDRLRDALAYRAENTTVNRRSAGTEHPSTPSVIRWEARTDARPLSRAGSGARRGILAVAAAIALVLLGVGVFAPWNDPPQAGEQPALNDEDRDASEAGPAVQNDTAIAPVTPTTVPPTVPPASTMPDESCEACLPEPDIIGTLDVALIGVSVAVGDGIENWNRREQPGLDPAGVAIGDPGVAIIRGNRTTFGAPFYCLGDLTPGDIINATTDDGEFQFTVTGTEILPLDAPLPEAAVPTLLLTAFHPKYTVREQIRVTAVLDTTPIDEAEPVIVQTSCYKD